MPATRVRDTSNTDSATRREFAWRGNTPNGAITIVRTGQSSPVFIQQNR
jgi:hypothetical protein